MPTYIEPCLPKLVDLAPTGNRWIHEIKHDGYRLAVRIDAGDVRLLSRAGLNWTSRFPLIDQAARELRQKSVYIDGEVVIDGADGISDWPALHSCASAGRCPGPSLWAFDLLFLGGKDLRALPLVERKEMLAENLAPPSGGIRYVEFLEGDGPILLGGDEITLCSPTIPPARRIEKPISPVGRSSVNPSRSKLLDGHRSSRVRS
jgi:bifunctional non-homologous end joining protein LigD